MKAVIAEWGGFSGTDYTIELPSGETIMLPKDTQRLTYEEIWKLTEGKLRELGIEVEIEPKIKVRSL